MPEKPLEIFERIDPELHSVIKKTADLALGDNALPRKIKLLIAMALDAAHGAVGGVKALAGLALQAGATQGEIADALRVAYHVSGVGSIYTAAHALKDVL